MITAVSTLVVALAVVGQGRKPEAVLLVSDGIFNKEDAQRFEADPPWLFRTKSGNVARIRLEFGNSPKRLWDDQNVRYVLQVAPKVGQYIQDGAFGGGAHKINVSYSLMMRADNGKPPLLITRGKYSYNERSSPLAHAVAIELPHLTLRAIDGDLGRRVFSERWHVFNSEDGTDRDDWFQRKLLVGPEGRSVELRAINSLPVSLHCIFYFSTDKASYRHGISEVGSSHDEQPWILEPEAEKIGTFIFKNETASSAAVSPRLAIYDPELAPVPSRIPK